MPGVSRCASAGAGPYPGDPKKEMARIAESSAADEALLGHLLVVAQTVAKEEGLHETGFRLVINNGRDGGESVAHLHVHLLGDGGWSGRRVRCCGRQIISHNICCIKQKAEDGGRVRKSSPWAKNGANSLIIAASGKKHARLGKSWLASLLME